MSVLDDLIRARDHISDPAMWYKGAFSKTGSAGAKNGQPCCAVGALLWVGKSRLNLNSRLYYALECALSDDWFSTGEFNDDPATTHADILALFDRAIAAERAKIGGAL